MTEPSAEGAPDPGAVDERLLRRARRVVVAIDGPAGSGKSSVAAAVAAALDARHLDTGAIYRAITLACMRAAVPLTDGDACAGVAHAARIEQAAGRTALDGVDVEDEIRSDEISERVSTVSAHQEV